ncbi:TPA: A24 family peptidase [Candidatus Bathyarchaeota archaeon]|nr:A24 family peptidase [Candidatus Bathyarchaeota archaeon]
MLSPFSALEAASLFLTLVFLIYASWRDWREREVSDRVWLLYAPVGGLLTALRAGFYGKPDPTFWLIGLTLTSLTALALYFAGFWGGADSKALLCLALTLPEMPGFCQPFLGLYLLFIPFTALFNTFILTLTVTVYAALRNLWYKAEGKSLFQGFGEEPIRRKALAVFAGYKVKPERLLGNPSLSLAEAFTPEGGRKLSFRFKVGGEPISKKALAELPEEVWVTPQLPILVFLTAGLVVALLFGDLVLGVVAWFLSLI